MRVALYTMMATKPVTRTPHVSHHTVMSDFSVPIRVGPTGGLPPNVGRPPGLGAEGSNPSRGLYPGGKAAICTHSVTVWYWYWYRYCVYVCVCVQIENGVDQSELGNMWWCEWRRKRVEKKNRLMQLVVMRRTGQLTPGREERLAGDWPECFFFQSKRSRAIPC